MKITATKLAEIDNVCDYIPFVSTVTNLIDIFLKYVLKHLVSETTAKNRYWTHIEKKDLLRSCMLLVPILGNVYVISQDYLKYIEDKIDCENAIKTRKDLEKIEAGALARIASQISGHEVTAEQMMPAQSEDQLELIEACIGEDAKALQELLNSTIYLNFFHKGQTPLGIACQFGSKEMVEQLIKGGAKVNTRDRLGNHPFASACLRGDLGIVRLLRPHVEDINAPAAKGLTALMFASGHGHRDIVEYLIAEGADLKISTPDSVDAASSAIVLGDHADLLPLLLPDDEDVDSRKYWLQLDLFSPRIANMTPLLLATLTGAKNSALYLVSRSNVMAEDSTNNNALFYAFPHIELLQRLLRTCSRPDFVNHQNIAGSTPLHHAIELNHEDAALLLLQSGADPFTLNRREKSSLNLACEKGFGRVIEYVQQHFADRIPPEMQQQIDDAPEAPIARIEPPRSLASLGLSLMQTGLEGMETIATIKAQKAKDLEDLGPHPRSSMEIFLGTHPWPA